MTSFIKAPTTFFTSESVTEGHPDKMCDAISDAILDDILRQDPMARVACETSTTTGLVLIMGEITTSGYVDMPTIVRDTVKRIGYTSADYGFDYETCSVITSIDKQSPDIALGVDHSRESKEMSGPVDEELEIGAGDQGMVIGYACNETEELMPMPIMLAHRLSRRLAQVRKEGLVPYLRPDGKSQVTVQYAYGRPVRVDTVVLSTQHDPDIDQERIMRDMDRLVIQHVFDEVNPDLLDKNTKRYINPTGRFVVGGPKGDSGLTGRKIIVDTYGGMARHGGGAFSGKDPTKVDRSASYMARYVAKNVVAAGLADRFEIQIAYAIGVAKPLAIMCETFDTNHVPDEQIIALVREHFDLRPGAIIRDLDLRRPIYAQTAAYGHFGRHDLDLPWERTDKADALREAAGSLVAQEA